MYFGITLYMMPYVMMPLKGSQLKCGQCLWQTLKGTYICLKDHFELKNSKIVNSKRRLLVLKLQLYRKFTTE